MIISKNKTKESELISKRKKSEIAKEITKNVSIPTIGIGASKYCDGQILVTEDMLGLSNSLPKFVKRYGNLNKVIEKYVKKYVKI